MGLIIVINVGRSTILDLFLAALESWYLVSLGQFLKHAVEMFVNEMFEEIVDWQSLFGLAFVTN